MRKLLVIIIFCIFYFNDAQSQEKILGFSYDLVVGMSVSEIPNECTLYKPQERIIDSELESLNNTLWICLDRGGIYRFSVGDYYNKAYVGLEPDGSIVFYDVFGEKVTNFKVNEKVAQVTAEIPITSMEDYKMVMEAMFEDGFIPNLYYDTGEIFNSTDEYNFASGALNKISVYFEDAQVELGLFHDGSGYYSLMVDFNSKNYANIMMDFLKLKPIDMPIKTYGFSDDLRIGGDISSILDNCELIEPHRRAIDAELRNTYHFYWTCFGDSDMYTFAVGESDFFADKIYVGLEIDGSLGFYDVTGKKLNGGQIENSIYEEMQITELGVEVNVSDTEAVSELLNALKQNGYTENNPINDELINKFNLGEINTRVHIFDDGQVSLTIFRFPEYYSVLIDFYSPKKGTQYLDIWDMEKINYN